MVRCPVKQRDEPACGIRYVRKSFVSFVRDDVLHCQSKASTVFVQAVFPAERIHLVTMPLSEGLSRRGARNRPRDPRK
jgi:hypothetical protein